MVHGRPIRIATRASKLAIAQSRLVAARLEDIGQRTELVTLSTRGDRTAGALAGAGGKGLFTEELSRALHKGDVDIAVHSAKDLPVHRQEGVVIAVVPERADAADVLVSRVGPLEELPSGAVIGTGSPRRAAQIRALRDDLRVASIRGNVDTRVQKALQEPRSVDAVVLARAGLERLGLVDSRAGYIHPLPEEFIPAAGQGALAVECCCGRAPLQEFLAALSHAPSFDALLAERDIVRCLGADCHSCLGVHIAQRGHGRWLGRAMVARRDGSGMLRAASEGAGAEEAGQLLLSELVTAGAKALLGT